MVTGNPPSPPREYLGMAGTVLALLGMFMPCMEVWFVRASYADALLECDLGILIPVIFLAAAVTFFLFFRAISHARWIGAALLVGLILSIVPSKDSVFSSGVMDYLEYGFWVMVIGLVLVILSPSLTGANQAIAALFAGHRPDQPHRPQAAPQHVPQWTCKACGKKNTGSGNFCPACGEPNPTKLFCPSCGKPVVAGDVFCMHCRVNLAQAKKETEAPSQPAPTVSPKAPAPPEPPAPEAPPEPSPENASPAEGVWQLGISDRGVPRTELVLTPLPSKTFVFDLTQNGVYSIRGRVTSLNDQGTATFQTEDGAVSGMLSFEPARALLFVEASRFPYLDVGDVLIFDTRSDHRAL